MTTLKEMIKIYSPILLSEDEDLQNVVNAFKAWLQQYHKPIQPYNNQRGYTKEEWCMREIARQCQIEELSEELNNEN